MGFRGVRGSRCAHPPLSIPSLPCTALLTNGRRFETAETLGIGKGGGGNTIREKAEMRVKKDGFGAGLALFSDPLGSAGPRGFPLCPPSRSPFSSIHYADPPANKRRLKTTDSLGYWGRGRRVETRREKAGNRNRSRTKQKNPNTVIVRNFYHRMSSA